MIGEHPTIVRLEPSVQQNQGESAIPVEKPVAPDAVVRPATVQPAKTLEETIKQIPRVQASWAKDGVTSFYCGIFAALWQNEGLCFRTIPSFSPKFRTTQFKAPGGDDNQTYEIPVDCAAREWKEEVMKPHSKVFLPTADIRCIYVRDVQPDEKFPDGIHRKSFWFVWENSLPNYRNAGVHFRTNNKDDGDNILLPPVMKQATWLAGNIYKTHLHALALAILTAVNDDDRLLEVVPERLLDWAELPEHVVGGRPIYYRA